MLEPLTAQTLKLLPFFKDMAPQELDLLSKASTLQSHSKNSHIFLRGDAAHSFYVVMNGWVKLYRDTFEGDEVILGLLTRPDTFGETSIFSGETHAFSAQAVEDTKIIAIPAAALKERAKTDLDVLVRIMQSFSQQMNKLQLENEHLTIMSASQRVGCMLLQLVEGTLSGTKRIQLPYEKSLAASRLGMKPETFSRALAQLKDIGITVNGNSVQIDNISDLVDFVCSDCSACSTDCHFSATHHCSPEDKARCTKG